MPWLILWHFISSEAMLLISSPEVKEKIICKNWKVPQTTDTIFFLKACLDDKIK